MGLIIGVAIAALPSPPTGLSYSMGAVLPGVSALSSPLGFGASQPAVQPTARASASLEGLFEGGADSLVARSVGHAEGTRSADGQRTAAYYGHVDPGNAVWNLGSFSYQHGAASPEEADEKQLQRLKEQARQLRQQAADLNLSLSLEEELNGIDLANQAPLAALGENGYIPRLAEARQRQLRGADAIVWARTWAYVDPQTRELNAPGLGNRLWRVRADQDRRRRAISTALQMAGGEARLAAVVR
ncbi:MAG: hypothetical protein AAF289_04275 [Cyanobacteria bacterium P01_A01_bin.135]